MEGAFCCPVPDLMTKLLPAPIKQRSRDRKNQIGTDDLSEKSLW